MAPRAMRSGRVGGGRVDTTNSAVVGEGRRMRKYGAVVNIVAVANSVATARYVNSNG